MNITVIGTGYVGLVTGACFAETGNTVTCVDTDIHKVEQLKKAEIPFFEPGLSDLVRRNTEQGRLQFLSSLEQTAKKVDLYFVCVGTPSREDGSANLDYVYQCVEQIAALHDETLIVIKSTVPIGTNAKVRQFLNQMKKPNIQLASNPEFLREGSAVEDSLKPDRVVVGISDPCQKELFEKLYKPFFRQKERLFLVSPQSAEMTKYASNCYLATRISFINEVSQLCEEVGANISEVRGAMGADARIGTHYLYPSVGIGGSCFPKDLRAMKAMYDEKGLRPEILTAVLQTNRNQKNRFFQKIEKHFDGDLAGKKVAIWGTAFKARTDDIRESAALDIIQKLLDARAQVVIYDPEAMANTQNHFKDKITTAKTMYDALKDADALCIMTEWNEFRSPDFEKIQTLMKTPLIFDGRNLLDPMEMKKYEIPYYSIGRPLV